MLKKNVAFYKNVKGEIAWLPICGVIREYKGNFKFKKKKNNQIWLVVHVNCGVFPKYVDKQRTLNITYMDLYNVVWTSLWTHPFFLATFTGCLHCVVHVLFRGWSGRVRHIPSVIKLSCSSSSRSSAVMGYLPFQCSPCHGWTFLVSIGNKWEADNEPLQKF